MHVLKFINKAKLKGLLTNTYVQSLKISENSPHITSFKCLALICVICPLLKSNTSSLYNKINNNKVGGASEWEWFIAKGTLKGEGVYCNQRTTLP